MNAIKLNLVFLAFIIAAGVIVYNLGILQIQKGDRYKSFSQGLHTDQGKHLKGRGEIFLKKEKPLAINIEESFVFINSKLIKDLSKIIDSLSQILNLEKGSIEKKIEEHSTYAILKKGLSEEEIKQVKNLDTYGVFVNTEKRRYYPQEKLLSPVVGFVGAKDKGQYGLEEAYENKLKLKKGVIEDQKGSDLFLTIDYNIQFKAETLLEKAKKDLGIKNGQIIVVNPETGAIKAMASLSKFNPNNYEKYAQEDNLAVFKNPSTQELFEPGSVFKPITMAGGIEEGKITPETTYKDPGYLEINGYPIYNYEKRQYSGELSMTNVLEKSINTGAVFAQQKLGGDLFLKYLEKFGIFEPTGIDIQETYSENKAVKTKRKINLVTASFGQGIVMTPIQLIKAYCAIANNGKRVTPYLVEKTVDAEGNVSHPNKEETNKQIISEDTVSKLVSMLISVVENGFGKEAKVPGYFIAGKTGTAQVSYGSLGMNKAGYSDETIQSFIGFAPAYNPEFLILVKLDNPETKTAEYSAIPIFQKMAEYIIRQYQIPFDYEN